MMILHKYALALLTFIGFAAQAEMSADGRYTILMPLLSKDSRDIFIGAKSIQYGTIRDQEVLDVAARRLWDCGEISAPIKTDDMACAVLAEAIGETGQARYRPMMEQLANSAQHPSLRSRAASALPALMGEVAGAFDPAQLDLDKLRIELQQMRVASRQNLDSKAGFPIAADTLIADVYQKMGYPDSIGVGMGIRGFYGMDLNYFGIGIVRMDNETNSRTHVKGWQVNWSWAEIAHPVLDDAHPDAALAHHIMSAEPRQLLSIANYLKRDDVHGRYILDAAADRLWLSMGEQDSDGIDAQIALVDYFGQLRAGRYRQLLSDLSQNAGDSGVRKHAAKAVEKLNSQEQDVYQRRDSVTTAGNPTP